MNALAVALAGLVLTIVAALVGAMLWMANIGRGIGRIETKVDTHGDHLTAQSARLNELDAKVDDVRIKVAGLEGERAGQHMATLSGGLKAVK